MNPAEAQKIDKAARELVERARLHDQNAVAMLVRVRENAAKGVGRAKYAYEAALAHAKGKRPPPAPTKVGADPLPRLKAGLAKVRRPDDYLKLVLVAPGCSSGTCAAEVLSRGPKIGNDLLSAIGATFGSDGEKKAYEYAILGPKQGVQKALRIAKPAYQRALRTGYVIGLAQRLQAVRAGNIAAISPKAAWELT